MVTVNNCDCERCEYNEDGYCYAEDIDLSSGGVCLCMQVRISEEVESADSD